MLNLVQPNYSRYIYFFGLLIGALVLGSQFLSFKMFHVVYCDTGKAPEVPAVPGQFEFFLERFRCHPCPPGATCKGGIATCPDGQYLSRDRACKPEQKFQREKDLLFGQLRDYLAAENGPSLLFFGLFFFLSFFKKDQSLFFSFSGKFICNPSTGHKYLHVSDLRRLAQNYVTDEANREKLFEAGLKDIEAKKATYDLKMLRVDGEQVFEALKPQIPFSCQAEKFIGEFWATNSEYIMMTIAVFVVILTIVWRFKGTAKLCFFFHHHLRLSVVNQTQNC